MCKIVQIHELPWTHSLWEASNGASKSERYFPGSAIILALATYRTILTVAVYICTEKTTQIHAQYIWLLYVRIDSTEKHIIIKFYDVSM